MRDSNRSTLSVLISVTVDVRRVERKKHKQYHVQKFSSNEIPCDGGEIVHSAELSRVSLERLRFSLRWHSTDRPPFSSTLDQLIT
jgi:hypothetical protein